MISPKGKGLFVDILDGTARVARTNSLQPPLTIEGLEEVSLSDHEAATETLRGFAGIKAGTYINSACAIYPVDRLVARSTIEPKKLKDGAFVAEHLKSQLNVDIDKYNLFILSAKDGADSASPGMNHKEVLACGASGEQLSDSQENILELGLFPSRIELGSVSTLGMLVDYLSFEDIKTPTLLLEICEEMTHVFVVSADGVDISRSVGFGISSMIPVIQKELGLKDEESAKKLFFSNSFDFTGLGPQLVKKLIRELQASIGFYEVQTGQSIGQLYCTLLPPKLFWLHSTLSEMLGVPFLTIDFINWLKSHEIKFADSELKVNLTPAWTGLFSLMGNYGSGKNEKK